MFVEDESRTKSLLCPRRAGKTTALVADLRITTLENDGICQFWAPTRIRAKQLAWELLKGFDRRLGLREGVDVIYNETELTSKLRIGGCGEIRLLGADKPKEIQKKRGDRVRKASIDESQLMDSFLEALCFEIIEPSLMDLSGSLNVAGSPGPVRAGFWNRVTDWKLPKDQRIPGFINHRWSSKQNTALPNLWKEFQRFKVSRKWDDNNPTWVREFLGEWVDDENALYYAFRHELNAYNCNNLEVFGGEWVHILGWDLGLRDEMALVIWAFHPERRDLYEAFSWKKSGALIDEIAALINTLGEKFAFLAMVADTGGGGAMFVAEMQNRYGFHFEPAKKTEKWAHVELFNSELRSGRIKLIEGSPYCEEIARLPKDPDWDLHTARIPKEDPRYPNHCCDAGLYAWRYATNYFAQAKRPQLNDKEAIEQMAKEMERKRAENLIRRRNEDWASL